MKHVAESAERILTTDVPTVSETALVSDVWSLLRQEADVFETVNYIYIKNTEEQLVGVVSLKELLRLPDYSPIRSAMTTQVVTARLHTDQERVAQLALTHNLKAIPVVDKTGKFMGVVPSDKILGVLNLEHTEDVMRFAGVRHKHEVGSLATVLLASSPITHVRLRLPWLILGLLGGILAAVVVGWFEATLAEQLILAAFIPAIVYMADAVGSQTQMLFIRALSVKHDLAVVPYLGRELLVNFILGVILSALSFGLSLFWLESMTLSLIIGVSIFLTVWGTVLIAIALPWFFHTHGKDPAIASGPLATVVRDIMSLCIYLAVATIFL